MQLFASQGTAGEEAVPSIPPDNSLCGQTQEEGTCLLVKSSLLRGGGEKGQEGESVAGIETKF